MSELGTINWIDNAIYTAAQLNAGQRRLSAELQDLLMHWLFDASAPGAGAGGVLGGLAVTKVSGQMQVTVSPGAAFYYDAGLASPLSKFSLVLLRAATVKTLSDGDATNDRIDVISIESPTGTDNTESTLTYGGSSTNRDTQRGAQPSVVVTEGTPAGSPSAPATPSGHLKLAEVLVKAGETNLDDAANVITDSRVYSRGPVNRDDTPIKWHLDGAGVDEVLQVDVGGSFVSALGWDQDIDYPVFSRQNSISGESVDEHYPMLIDGSREWWKTFSMFPIAWGYGTGSASNLTVEDMNDHGFTYALLEWVNTGSVAGSVYRPIPVENRGVEIVGCKVQYDINTAWDGTAAFTAKLYKVGNDSAHTEIGSVAVVEEVTGEVTAAMTMSDTPVLSEGESLLLIVSFSSSGGTGGDLVIRNVRVQFKEGRA